MSSLTYKTTWFGIPWISEVVCQLQTFQRLSTVLGTSLQSLTPANLPNVMSFPLPLSHSASAPLAFFEFFWVKLCPASGPSTYTIPSAWNILPSFYLKPREASCYPYTKVSSFGLGLYPFHLLTFFTACFHYFIFLFTCSSVFVLCDPPLTPSPFILSFVSRENFFFVYHCIPKPTPEAW